MNLKRSRKFLYCIIAWVYEKKHEMDKASSGTLAEKLHIKQS